MTSIIFIFSLNYILYRHRVFISSVYRMSRNRCPRGWGQMEMEIAVHNFLSFNIIPLYFLLKEDIRYLHLDFIRQQFIF